MITRVAVTTYPPATFYPCRAHPGADAAVVACSTWASVDDERPLEAVIDEPVCAECGGSLAEWRDPDPALEQRWARTFAT